MIAKKYLVENYECSEYLSEFDAGYYSEWLKLQLILPYEEISINSKHHHLILGLFDEDRMELCYRFQSLGLWLFDSTVEKYQQVVPTLKEFIKHWEKGENTL